MPVCSKCKLDKEHTEFNFKDKAKGTKQTTCRGCASIDKRNHYERNKATYKSRAIKSKKALSLRNKLYVYRYLKERSCIDCGENDPVVLEFDHVSGEKVKAISSMMLDAVSLARLEAELSKCVVRCANCHRRKTAKELNWAIVGFSDGTEAPTVFW